MFQLFMLSNKFETYLLKHNSLLFLMILQSRLDSAGSFSCSTWFLLGLEHLIHSSCTTCLKLGWLEILSLTKQNTLSLFPSRPPSPPHIFTARCSWNIRLLVLCLASKRKDVEAEDLLETRSGAGTT